jgi:hypothetical protein
LSAHTKDVCAGSRIKAANGVVGGDEVGGISAIIASVVVLIGHQHKNISLTII